MGRGVTLIEGDAMQILPEIPDETIDFVLTDPPYGLGKKYGRHELGSRRCKGDVDTVLACWCWAETMRLLKRDRWAAMFCGWSTVGEVMEAAKAVGLGIKTVITWDKALPGLGQGIRNQYEMIVLARKGKPVSRYAGGNVWKVTRERNRPVHPNQKPLPLLRLLIERYSGQGLILDPFAGAGSTLVAAAEVGLPAIGIELDEGYWEKARERLSTMGSTAPSA